MAVFLRWYSASSLLIFSMSRKLMDGSWALGSGQIAPSSSELLGVTAPTPVTENKQHTGALAPLPPSQTRFQRRSSFRSWHARRFAAASGCRWRGGRWTCHLPPRQLSFCRRTASAANGCLAAITRQEICDKNGSGARVDGGRVRGSRSVCNRIGAHGCAVTSDDS